VCSVADLFANWTPIEWREKVLNEIQKPEYNHLTFQLLTKNPENIKLKAKKNIWIGVTITKQEELPLSWDLQRNYVGLKFLSFEPILGYIFPLHSNLMRIDWIIIGKLTGSNKIKLNKKWVEYLIEDCKRYDIPIFLKNNLNWHEKIQEFPNG
jgi:protein gp37